MEDEKDFLDDKVQNTLNELDEIVCNAFNDLEGTISDLTDLIEHHYIDEPNDISENPQHLLSTNLKNKYSHQLNIIFDKFVLLDSEKEQIVQNLSMRIIAEVMYDLYGSHIEYILKGGDNMYQDPNKFM